MHAGLPEVLCVCPKWPPRVSGETFARGLAWSIGRIFSPVHLSWALAKSPRAEKTLHSGAGQKLVTLYMRFTPVCFGLSRTCSICWGCGCGEKVLLFSWLLYPIL